MKKIAVFASLFLALSCSENEAGAESVVLNEEIIVVDYSADSQIFTYDENLELVNIEMECIYPCERQFDSKTKFQFDDVQFVDFTPEIIGNTIVFKKEYHTSETNINYWNKSKKFKLTFKEKL